MAIFSNSAKKMSSLLGGRVVSIKQTLLKHCFSSSLHRSETTTTTPLSASAWLMIPPTLVADDLKHCPHCNKKTVKSNSEAEDDDYDHFLNAADNNIVFKKRKNLWMPWQTDHLSPNEAICIGSSHGWLAYIHPRNCSLYLYNPFTDDSLPYLPLPPIETLPPFLSSTRRLNASSVVVTEFTLWKQKAPVSAQDTAKGFFRKLVMSSAPTTPNHYHSAHVDQDSQPTIMAIYSDAHRSRRLAFCRIGDTSWTALNSPSPTAYVSWDDVLYFSEKKLFYALSMTRCIESWDLTNPSSPKRRFFHINYEESHHYFRGKSYLVESLGDLLMVLRYRSDDHSDTTSFRVHKWDFDDNKWVPVSSLGDRLLFIGQNHAVSLSAHDIPGLTQNSIYFTSSDYLEHGEGCSDLGVFNLNDDKLYKFDLTSKIQAFSPIWVLPSS